MSDGDVESRNGAEGGAGQGGEPLPGTESDLVPQAEATLLVPH